MFSTPRSAAVLSTEDTPPIAALIAILAAALANRALVAAAPAPVTAPIAPFMATVVKNPPLLNVHQHIS